MMPLPFPDPALEARFPHRHDRAYAYLKALLLDGGLDPNDVVSTEAIARALNVSRAPVTDATKRIARDGFFRIVPQVGCIVSAPQPAEVADFYRLFAKAEGVITALAAERCTPPQADALRRTAAGVDAEFDKLRGERYRGPELRILNRRRYRAIHEIAGSSIAGDLVANMWDRSDYYIRLAYGAFVYSAAIQDAHRAICDAIAGRDAAAAATRTENYLNAVGQEISAMLRHAGGQPAADVR